MKKLIQVFVLVVTGAATAILVDKLKPSLHAPEVAAAALAAGALLLALLELKHLLPVNWWWHRFWYLRDLRTYARTMLYHASQIDTPTSNGRKLPAIQVLVNANRTDLVPYAVARLRARSQRVPRLFVQGDPGSGKSFAALQTADELARAAQWRPWLPMPIFVRLDQYREGALEDYVKKQVLTMTVGNSGKVISGALDRLLRKGHVALVLDALDETPDAIRTKMLAELGNFGKPSRDRVPLLMTVRARELLASEIPLPLDPLEVQPLDDTAVDAFIRHVRREPVDDPPEEIRFRLETQSLLGPSDLGRNPFWLNIILTSGVFNKSNRAVLLQTAAERLLTREWTKPESKRSWKKVEARDEQIRHTLTCLGWIAYQMTQAGLLSVGTDEARLIGAESIEKRLGVQGLKPEDVLGIGRDASLLDYAGGGSVRFSHRLLQEYFAASAIYGEPPLLTEHLLRSTATDAKWWPALLMLAELHNETALLRDDIAGLVRSVAGSFDSAMRLVLANSMLWGVAEILNKALVKEVREPLASWLSARLDAELVSAGARLASISPEAFVRVLRPLAETDELRQSLTRLLSKVLAAAVRERTADAVIVQLFENVYLRETTTAALIELGDSGKESIVRALHQRPSWGLVATLCSLPTRAALDHLLNLLPTADEFLRGQIVEALGAIGDPRAIPALEKVAHHDEDPLVRTLAADALSKIGPAALDALLNLAARDDLLLLLHIDAAVARMGAVAVPRLLRALQDKNSKVRRVAASFFEHVEVSSSCEALVQLLRDTDPVVSLNALRALKRQGRAAAVPLLRYIEQENEDAFLFYSAVATLGRLGPDTLDALLDVSRHPLAKMRKVSCDALANLRDTRARPRLEELLAADPDAGVRSAAATALSNLTEPEVDYALREALNDNSFRVRLTAAAGLAKLGDAAAHKYLLKKLDEGVLGGTDEQNHAIRYIVGRALAEIRSAEAVPILERLAQQPPAGAEGLRAYAEHYRKMIADITRGQRKDDDSSAPVAVSRPEAI